MKELQHDRFVTYQLIRYELGEGTQDIDFHAFSSVCIMTSQQTLLSITSLCKNAYENSHIIFKLITNYIDSLGF